MIKGTSLRLTFIALLIILLAGCTNELKSKTVIIPDPKVSAELDKINEDFTVNKIYSLFENANDKEDILGWLNKNELLGVQGADSGWSFERLDYKLNSRQKLTELTGSLDGISLSPDGKYLAYFVKEKDKLKWMLLNMASNQKIVVDANVVGQYESEPLTWSNNSQFVFFRKLVRGEDSQTSLVVYDVNQKSTEALLLPHDNLDAGFKIADDGKSALAFRYVDGENNLIYGKLAKGEFNREFESSVGDIGVFDYINNDQILFVNLEGSLILYDSRNATSTTLSEHISNFKLSKDRKYITYSNDKQEIFVAKLQGNTLINEKSIYKGFISLQMEWSPDDKKILLSGRKLYGIVTVPRVAAPVVSSEQASLNNAPFIIEFK